jgi:hypothetical protein
MILDVEGSVYHIMDLTYDWVMMLFFTSLLTFIYLGRDAMPTTQHTNMMSLLVGFSSSLDRRNKDTFRRTRNNI